MSNQYIKIIYLDECIENCEYMEKLFIIYDKWDKYNNVIFDYKTNLYRYDTFKSIKHYDICIFNIANNKFDFDFLQNNEVIFVAYEDSISDNIVKEKPEEISFYIDKGFDMYVNQTITPKLIQHIINIYNIISKSKFILSSKL